MRFKSILLAALFAGAIGLPAGFAAEMAKTYQVTGPIVELTDKAIVVMKGDERWEIARDAVTKSKAPLKVGQKVTIHYRMTATAVEVRDADAAGEKDVGKARKK